MKGIGSGQSFKNKYPLIDEQEVDDFILLIRQRVNGI